MTKTEFTHDDFKAFKKAMKLKNEDIAAIVGVSKGNVNNTVRPGKKLPSWARAFCFMYESMKIV
jgi:DNA-binding XRE family transcriptional regulator